MSSRHHYSTRDTILKSLCVTLMMSVLGSQSLFAQAQPHANPGIHDPDFSALMIDSLLDIKFREQHVVPAPLVSDEAFFRRIWLDLAGIPPRPEDVQAFLENASENKRIELIDQLVDSQLYAENWAGYWKNVIYFNATDDRAKAFQSSFENWMVEQIKQNRPWDQIASELITAQGDVRANGQTALVFAHQGDPAEIAGEVSRILLGVQMSCANCHDHPTDPWKREQFHELAAYFTRARVVTNRDDGPRSFEVISMNEFRPQFAKTFFDNPVMIVRFMDTNRDGMISKTEAMKREQFGKYFSSLIEHCDENSDGMLTAKELQTAPRPQFADNGRAEYYMPDLQDPSAQGTLILPKLFTSEDHPLRFGTTDEGRRMALARSITSKDNQYFSKAYVNRIWSLLLGSAFTAHVDDMGPYRPTQFPEVLDFLAEGFVENHYDTKWLVRTITRSDAYQRAQGLQDTAEDSPRFASAPPIRLRAEQVYNSLARVYGTKLYATTTSNSPQEMMMMGRDPRDQFAYVFGVDPSLNQDDIPLDVPQTLFMMNSSQVAKVTSGSMLTPLSQILNKTYQPVEVIRQIYLLGLNRYPSQKELELCLSYARSGSGSTEAYEDILWSLVNSTEFITRP